MGADSTRVPRYITATVSQMWATTLRSWLMKRKVFISSPRNDSSRLRMSAWMETSSAATLSSATTNLGLQTKARAMEILWRCPPEKAWGKRRRCSRFRRHFEAISRTRSSVAARVSVIPITSSGSAMMSRTVIRGLSAAYGSWKINCARDR